MTPMTDERLAECRCIREEILECLDCHAPLERVPRDRMLNEDQWDAVKAGDYFCSGNCRSDKARSGKRYFNRGQLPTILLRECALCIVKSDNDRLRAEVERLTGQLEQIAKWADEWFDWDLGDPAPDKSQCPYFIYQHGGPRGTCSFGCREEPSCITDRPRGGWPREQHPEPAQ